MNLSIIIVNYNTCELTFQAIKSILQSRTTYDYEIILIDNNSTDNSVERVKLNFPEVKLIENKENMGFSKANNQGMRVARGKYILLLNSDTIINDDTLNIMLNFMDQNPLIGASGCKVLLEDGSLDKACKRGFPTPKAAFYYISGFSKSYPQHPKYNQYHLGHINQDMISEVDSIVGAFMIVRQETIEDVGMLDETFFMYGEDIDWCYRIKEAGWKIYYYPKTSILHLKGGSSKRRPMKIIYEFHRAMYLFHRKHYHSHYNKLINCLVYVGISSLFVVNVMKNLLRLGD